MAQQTSVSLVDDLDGGKAAETVAFGLDGSSFEIDLSKKNAAALRKALRRPAVLPTPTLALKTRFGSEMVEDALLSGQRLLPARLLDAGFEFSAATIDVALERALSA